MEIDNSFIEEYLELYEETQGVSPERLDEFGRKYRRQGHLRQDDLYEIAYESSQRSAHHVRRNPEGVCIEVTGNVLAVEEEFSQIALLSALHGFKAPTSSCVTTALAPQRHAVIDTRVWASLERTGYLEGHKESFDAFDYVVMLDEIRGMAEKTGYTTAEVGYALFAHDYDTREGTLH